MVLHLLLLLSVAHLGTTYPAIQDNKLPTEEDILRALLKDRDERLEQGQPEIEDSLGLPSDEESYNKLQTLYALGIPGPSGTHHFVSSSFPEIDARGFHESVFENFGDYYPAWGRHKRDPLGINARGFHDDVFNRDFGSFHTVKKSSTNHLTTEEAQEIIHKPSSPYTRRKRDTTGSAGEKDREGEDNSNKLTTNEHKDLNNKHRRDVSNVEELEAEKRRPEMDSTGFHGDTFDGGFGEFWTMKKNEAKQRNSENSLYDNKVVHKRRNGMGMGPSGFHGDTFTSGFGDFSTMKRSQGENYENPEPADSKNEKRIPELDSSGFYGDTFRNGLGDLWNMKKRKPEMDSSGFYGDTFNNGFGDFWTMKKRRPDMDASGFHGDTFNNGFGEFWTMKKRKPEMDSSGFYGDTFNNGFGDFWTMKKRRPDMDSSGFHGDTFSNGFGEFWTMKKRKPEMGSTGFHGDTFSDGFGDFWTMKKKNSDGDYGYGDFLRNGYGNFWTMKKRRPEMDSSGFHGDTFSGGFGDFWTMKKRKPEMGSNGFHGDTFSNGFGEFWTMKKRSANSAKEALKNHSTGSI